MNDASETATLGDSHARREQAPGTAPGRGYRRLFAALLVAGWIAAAIVAVAPWTALRAVAGLLLVGVIPGALASYAVLPPASRIDGRLRACLAFSLSVAVSLVLGLGLALASDEISRVAAAIGLAVALTAAGVIAFARDDGRTALTLPRRPAIAPAVAIVTGLVALVAIGTVVAAVNVDTLSTDFTALALTREEGAVRLSVSSEEDAPTVFRYVLSDGRGVRLYSGVLRVEPGEDAAVLLPVAPGGGSVRAELFKGPGAIPYRSVDLRG
jgi:Protein of unknown function (DUF1616)